MNVLKMSDDELMNGKAEREVQLALKLTDWKREPKLKDLKYDLEQAKESQSKLIANLARWEKLWIAPKIKSKANQSKVQVKLVRKQAEWRCSALSEPFLSTPRLFDVKPLTKEDKARAMQNGLLLNRQFNTELNKVHLVDSIIRSVVKDGTAIVRLGWEYKEHAVKEKVPQYAFSPVPMEMQEQINGQYQEIAQLMQLSPDEYEANVPDELKAGFEMSQQQGQLLMASVVGETVEEVVKPLVNRPIAEVCNIKNIYIDPTCRSNFNNAQFVIHSYETSISELTQSGLYHKDNLDYLKMKCVRGSDGLNTEIVNHSFTFKDVARKKLIAYEYWGYWDIEGKGITKPIVATWVGDVLLRLEENPFPDGKPPFVVINYIPEEDSVYGIPDAELLEDNQDILSATMRGMLDLLGKSANSQTGFSKGFLDIPNKKKFREGDDYEFNPVGNPVNSIYTHKFPEIPNSALNMIQMMNNEAESLSGVKAFAGTGITANHLGDVAVGIRGVLDAVSKREMSILRRISDGFVMMGRKIMAMNAEWLSEQEVVRVTNSEFITVRRDDLKGEYDLTLSIATAESNDAKAKELAFMLQTMGNTMGMEASQIILAEIADLRLMPDLADKIRNYQPQPSEYEQQMQQLELQRVQAEVQVLQAQAQEAMAKSQVQEAKVSTEQAKANNLQNEADIKTLDFNERNSGVRHQREMDKLGANHQNILNQQQLKNEGLNQQLQDKHHARLIEQYMQNGLNQMNDIKKFGI